MKIKVERIYRNTLVVYPNVKAVAFCSKMSYPFFRQPFVSSLKLRP